MYNGIGLTTARGSGTSGYVQKNLSIIKAKNNTNYKTILEAFKNNPAPTKKKANNDLIEHEKKHKIENEIFKLSLEWEKEGLSPEEIQEKIKKAREKAFNKIKLEEDKDMK